MIRIFGPFFTLPFLFFNVAIAQDQVQSPAQTSRSLMTVTVQVSELAPRIKRIASDKQAALENEKSNVWIVADERFKELKKQYQDLPASKDTIAECSRNYVRFELLENGVTTSKFSCFNTSNSTRKKYVQFSRNIL